MTKLQQYLNAMKNVINLSDLNQVEGILKGFTPSPKFQGTYTKLLNGLIQHLNDNEKAIALHETNLHKCKIGSYHNEFVSTLPETGVVSIGNEFEKKRNYYITSKLLG